MDWQAAAAQLLDLALTDRTYPADFDFEAEWPILLAEFRKKVGTDPRVENVELKQRLEAKDETYAVEQRLRSLGVDEKDIDLLRRRN